MSISSLKHFGKAGLKASIGFGRAPSTVANVGVGFDLLGFALQKKADEVRIQIQRCEPHQKRGVVSLKIEGESAELIPHDLHLNVTTVALNHFIDCLDLEIRCEVILKKGIPMSSGLGGSAASAVVGLMALNACLHTPCSFEELLPSALVGEAVASGAPHADNVAPCLFGGMTLCLPSGEIQQIPTVDGISVIMAHPQQQLETHHARSVLKPHVSLTDHTLQMGHFAGFLTGCFQNDPQLIRQHTTDLLIAPQRGPLIKGFKETQQYMKTLGAFGCEISGAGPSLFTLCASDQAREFADALAHFFGRFNPVDVWVEPWGAHGAQGKVDGPF